MAGPIRRSEFVNDLEIAGIVIRTSRQFGSATENHRANLRRALQEYIKAETTNLPRHVPLEFRHSVDELVNLKVRPRVPGWAISVSHCATLGGFLAIRSSNGVGIDFENENRVSEAITMRVASFPDEKTVLDSIKKASAACALFWVAKEASIKAFGNRFPDEAPHFGEVEISAIDLTKRTFTARRNGLFAHGRFLDFGAECDSDIVGAIASIYQS